jgi:threonine dehydrogenase-like Zn-dependent dehydrogenase
VDVLTRYPAQRRAGSQLGAGERIRSEYELVVAAAGSQSALDAAIAYAAPGTTVALAAMFGAGATIGVELSLKEVTLVPAFTYGHHGNRREFDEAVAVLAGNPEIASTMITHRFPLAAAPQAFSAAADRRSGAIKVVLEP